MTTIIPAPAKPRFQMLLHAVPAICLTVDLLAFIAFGLEWGLATLATTLVGALVAGPLGMLLGTLGPSIIAIAEAFGGA